MSCGNQHTDHALDQRLGTRLQAPDVTDLEHTELHLAEVYNNLLLIEVSFTKLCRRGMTPGARHSAREAPLIYPDIIKFIKSPTPKLWVART